jgi:hypothetical protein
MVEPDAGSCKPGDDCTPPVIVIEQPDGGAVLSGAVDISGTVIDNSQVPVKVELLIDNQVVDSNAMTPLRWSFRINTAAYNDGAHALEVRATDRAENKASATMTIRTEKIHLPTCPTPTWLMLYWPNQTLSGAPTIARCEGQAIDYDWDSGGVPGTAEIDSFALSWQGTQTFEAAQYDFVARADDGIRVWVDNVLIIDEWRHQTATTFTKRQAMTAGAHAIRVEYYEETDVSEVSFKWMKAM